MLVCLICACASRQHCIWQLGVGKRDELRAMALLLLVAGTDPSLPSKGVTVQVQSSKEAR
jgi:hypothetical protein